MPKTTFEFRPGFIPEAIFRPYTTLDGSCAAAFLEANGKTVIGFGDIHTNGIAVTDDGWTLSTNGMLGNNPEHVAACVEKLGRLGRLAPICDEGCTDPEHCEHPAKGFRYRDYAGQGEG